MQPEKSPDRTVARGMIGSAGRTGRSLQSEGGAKASWTSVAQGLALGAAVLAVAVLAGCDGGPGESAEGASRNAPARVREAGARVALVIGNSKYKSSAIGRLENPVRDAESVAEALDAADFEVVIEPNLEEDAFHAALEAFAEKSRRAATAAFYYAGHGMEQGGVNYLVPVDMKEPTHLHNAVELDEVMRSMQGERNLVFLDACRTLPGRGLRGASDSLLSRGLVAVSTKKGQQVVISYAAAAGKPALDGEAGGNSPYAAALAAHLVTPGQRLVDLLIEVRNTVLEATDEQQQPWPSGSLGAPFYFVPGDPVVTTVTGATETGGDSRPTLPAGSPWQSPAGMEFVWVPPGSFVMGSPEDESDHYGEQPQHEVRISRGYWMGKYEVTQGEWEAVMGANPSHFDDCGPRCPVESVTWHDMREFIGRLNEQESGQGYEYRLPSEAEWEYAARAETTGARYGVLDEIAWHSGNSGNRTRPVGGKLANPWGLHDMLGNVYEATKDGLREYASDTVTDPQGPSERTAALRGGGYCETCPVECVRSADRNLYVREDRGSSTGFRLVRTGTPERNHDAEPMHGISGTK